MRGSNQFWSARGPISPETEYSRQLLDSNHYVIPHYRNIALQQYQGQNPIAYMLLSSISLGHSSISERVLWVSKQSQQA